jgi:hypothetical protein
MLADSPDPLFAKPLPESDLDFANEPDTAMEPEPLLTEPLWAEPLLAEPLLDSEPEPTEAEPAREPEPLPLLAGAST